MSDLVKRLRDPWPEVDCRDEAADKIEQLERELAAEKALAGEYSDALANVAVMGFSEDPAVAANIAKIAVETARKARGL